MGVVVEADAVDVKSSVVARVTVGSGVVVEGSRVVVLGGGVVVLCSGAVVLGGGVVVLYSGVVVLGGGVVVLCSEVVVLGGGVVVLCSGVVVLCSGVVVFCSGVVVLGGGVVVYTQSVNSPLPAADVELFGHVVQVCDPTIVLYVPITHALHPFDNPLAQLAVKPVWKTVGDDLNRTRRCCCLFVPFWFMVFRLYAGGLAIIPLRIARLTTPSEHTGSPHCSIYTKSTFASVLKVSLNDTDGLVPLMIHQQSEL